MANIDAMAPESTRKSSFDPVVDQRTRVLILGSLPGDVSLGRGQYYAHPRNQFWRLIGDVIGQSLPASYEERLGALRAARIGLWDVVSSATRIGSLDTAIQGHRLNSLEKLRAGLPALTAIGFNGGKAWHLGRKTLADAAALTMVRLPSSSPAYTLAFEAKVANWRALREFL